MACTTGCLTKDHESFGACVRAKGLKVGWAATAKDFKLDATFQKRNERELEAYRNVRRQGIQPDTTSMVSIREAVEKSDRAGQPYVSTR